MTTQDTHCVAFLEKIKAQFAGNELYNIDSLLGFLKDLFNTNTQYKHIEQLDDELVKEYKKYSITGAENELKEYGTSVDKIKQVILNLLWDQIYFIYMTHCPRQISRSNDPRTSPSVPSKEMPKIFELIFDNIATMNNNKKEYFAKEHQLVHSSSTGGNLSLRNSLPHNLTRLLYKNYKYTYLLAKNI